MRNRGEYANVTHFLLGSRAKCGQLPVSLPVKVSRFLPSVNCVKCRDGLSIAEVMGADYPGKVMLIIDGLEWYLFVMDHNGEWQTVWDVIEEFIALPRGPYGMA